MLQRWRTAESPATIPSFSPAGRASKRRFARGGTSDSDGVFPRDDASQWRATLHRPGAGDGGASPRARRRHRRPRAARPPRGRAGDRQDPDRRGDRRARGGSWRRGTDRPLLRGRGRARAVALGADHPGLRPRSGGCGSSRRRSVQRRPRSPRSPRSFGRDCRASHRRCPGRGSRRGSGSSTAWRPSSGGRRGRGRSSSCSTICRAPTSRRSCSCAFSRARWATCRSSWSGPFATSR